MHDAIVANERRYVAGLWQAKITVYKGQELGCQRRRMNKTMLLASAATSLN